jgi:two-component system NtrC family sensor kinase
MGVVANPVGFRNPLSSVAPSANADGCVASPGPGASPDAPDERGSPGGPAKGAAAAILVVDDETDVAELIGEVLSIDGYDLEVALSGRDALARLNRRHFDLVVTDLRMQDIDGPALYAEAVRLQPSLSSRFIFTSGDLLDPGAKAFAAAPGRRSLPKPFRTKELSRLVSEALAEPRS